MFIGAAVGTAFFTFIEHKILGHTQLRKGPNKVGFMGILQPFADAVKLLSKELFSPPKGNYMIFIIAPILRLTISLLLWGILPRFSGLINIKLRLLFFFSCTAVSIHATLLAGWSSFSKYSLLGGLRSIAQTLSYEVVFALIIICVFTPLGLLRFIKQLNLWSLRVIFFAFPIFLLWSAICMAERNRTPFDFREGESELVSGFNTEFSSATFVLIFLAEYRRILFLRVLTAIVFFTLPSLSLCFVFIVIIIGSLFVWVRSTFPRLRYDKLIFLAWKLFLPGVLLLLFTVLLVSLT